jgi:hypothetical protein
MDMAKPLITAELKRLSKAIITRTNAMEAAANSALFFRRQNPDQAIEELAKAVKESIYLLEIVGSTLRAVHDVPHSIVHDD